MSDDLLHMMYAYSPNCSLHRPLHSSQTPRSKVCISQVCCETSGIDCPSFICSSYHSTPRSFHSRPEMRSPMTTPCCRVCLRIIGRLCHACKCFNAVHSSISLLCILLRVLRSAPLVYLLRGSERVFASSMASGLPVIAIAELQSIDRCARAAVPSRAMST